jgi:Trypsin-like serine proteases, typically periplasmic, contain C-terminal PDZ domain
MTRFPSGAPRISRETRLLLTIALISSLVLVALARVRFGGDDARGNTVMPVLAQLAPRSPFEDEAFAIFALTPRVMASVAVVDRQYTALRIQSDAAVAIMQEDHLTGAVLARDRPTGLALVRVPVSNAPVLTVWAPRRVDYARYLVAAELFEGRISLRPVFIGSMTEAMSPDWEASVWLTPADVTLRPGTLLFTTGGEMAGVAASTLGRLVIVPAEVVMNRAAALLEGDRKPPGELGLSVQPLTVPIARATGADSGVVITWSDPAGPAAGKLRPGSVIERVKDIDTPSMGHWAAAVARIDGGDVVPLRVRDRSGSREVVLTATALKSEDPAPTPTPPTLGLQMRRVKNGAQVVRVAPGSAGSRAGLRPRDVITYLDEQGDPAPEAIVRAFADLSPEAALLLAVTRDDSHHVLALQK